MTFFRAFVNDEELNVVLIIHWIGWVVLSTEKHKPSFGGHSISFGLRTVSC